MKITSRKIEKLQEGGIASYAELLPIYGTYKDFQRFRENPSWKTGISLGLSAAGDLAMLTGVGAAVKGASMLNKANKLRKTAVATEKLVGTGANDVLKFGKTLKREKDAVNSLSLMNAPTNVITDRVRKLNKAKQAYSNSLETDIALRKNISNLYNQFNQLINSAPTMSKVAPTIYTNPSFHAASKAIQKHQEGGNIPSANSFWKTDGGVANLMSQKAQNRKYNAELKNQLQNQALNMEYTAKNDRDSLIGNITPTTEIQNGETINNSGLADKNYVYTNAGGMFHAKNNFQRYADNYLANLKKQQASEFGSQVGGMVAQALPQTVQGIKDYRQFQDNRLEAYRNQQQNIL